MNRCAVPGGRIRVQGTSTSVKWRVKYDSEKKQKSSTLIFTVYLFNYLFIYFSNLRAEMDKCSAMDKSEAI